MNHWFLVVLEKQIVIEPNKAREKFVQESHPRTCVRSEHKLQTKLNDAGTTFTEPWITGSNVGCLTDCTKCDGVEIDVGKAEIRAVEDIDDFSAKLYGSTFRHPCQLIHREIDAVKIRADDYVPARISECTGGRRPERCFVEPLVRAPGTGIRVADKIRPIVQLAGAAGVHAEEGCDGKTALARVNSTELPTFCQSFGP